jgi:hypothetical protein
LKSSLTAIKTACHYAALLCVDNSVVKMRGNDDAIPYDCEAKTLGMKMGDLKGILREVRACDGWCL